MVLYGKSGVDLVQYIRVAFAHNAPLRQSSDVIMRYIPDNAGRGHGHVRGKNAVVDAAVR